MKRVSNLAFNREFPQKSGLPAIPGKNTVSIRPDPQNPFDNEAVAIWLDGVDAAPLGWLYRKDANREAAREKLKSDAAIAGHIELRNGRKVVVFWL